jgi:chloramphenicol-sensitive protein RarD
MPPMRWVGFGLVWLALVILTWDGLAQRRRTPALDPISTAL